MSVAAATHFGPWTEDDLAALPEDGIRRELLEGALLVNPPPSGMHQVVSFELTRQLKQGCPPDLLVVEGIGIRIPDHTMLVPDVLVAGRDAVMAARGGILDPKVVRLVTEIVSPGSRSMDRLTKPALYAQAGIPCFLRIELDDDPTVFAFTLHEGSYAEAGSAAAGETLDLPEPFPVIIDPAQLLP